MWNALPYFLSLPHPPFSEALICFVLQIADLGVACFKNWSRLTKEETNRQRKLKSASKNASQSNAGTLFYMAPEHLISLNIKPVEKSDVYSFGIVLWAIFANKEPYERKSSGNNFSKAKFMLSSFHVVYSKYPTNIK